MKQHYYGSGKLLLSGLLILLLAGSSLIFADSLSITASDEVRTGDSLKILLLYTNSSPMNISGLGCTIYALDLNNNTVEGTLITYDSLLNEPPSLKTNAGGRAYYSMPISNRFLVFTNATVVADCNGELASAQFRVLPYSNVDQVANIFLSLRDNGYGWIALILGGIFVVGFVIIVLKSILGVI